MAAICGWRKRNGDGGAIAASNLAQRRKSTQWRNGGGIN